MVSFTAFTQTGIVLNIISENQKSLPEKFSTGQPFNTKYEIQLAIKNYVQKLQKQGYLSASLDSLVGDTVKQTAFLFIGQKFEWAILHTDSVDEEILSRTGFRDKQFSDKPFNPEEISRFFNDALSYLENTGYPFAQIKLDQVRIDNQKIEASVILKKNKFYLVDSIQIIGEDTRLNRNYIENIIQVKAKAPYDERIIKNIGKRISENPFMDELKPYEVIFTENSCKIILILKPKKANVFDGIIGLQPQPDNKGMVLTGDVKISLGNIVGQGERLNLRWQRLQDQTQQINASIQVPFLFKTPIGFAYKLDIYRRDTTFNNVNHNFTIPFTLSNGSQFKGYFNKYNTSLISTHLYENSVEIPPYNDALNNTYGVGFSGFFVSNKFNPYSGWIIDLTAGAGSNKIIKNSQLEQVNYDSISLESSFLESHVNLSFLQPITRNTTLLLKANTAIKQSNNLVDNQLYRIGGLHTLRGFDEQSIFASSFAIATIEYRLLFDENSRISVFSDIGWYEQSSISNYKTDIPFGVGAGITFGTGVGLFSLNYALGSQFGNPVSFKTGKIHFGFINFF
jgi:hemolysin activation/secretion protein